MKRLLFAGAVLLAAAALAGQAARDATGDTPGFPMQNYGVTLAGAAGCRCSIRVDAGATNVIGSEGFASSGWRIVPMYGDPALATWVESPSALHCQPSARLDGGRIRQWVCPDMEPLAAFGRVYCMKYGLVGADAGSGADWIADGGVGPQPVVRTECWGPNMGSAP